MDAGDVSVITFETLVDFAAKKNMLPDSTDFAAAVGDAVLPPAAHPHDAFEVVILIPHLA
jgi:hypothetical protein